MNFPVHPGRILKEKYKGKRTHKEFLHLDIIKAHPHIPYADENIFKVWFTPTQRYLNGYNEELKPLVAYILSLATGVPIEELHLEHARYRYAMDHYMYSSYYNRAAFAKPTYTHAT